MTIRTNHYEVAFEAFLREEKVPYIAVDERRRALLGSGSLKNLDFIVSPSGGDMSWLIDIKGRKFPSGRRNRYWKNWTTTDDLQSPSRHGRQHQQQDRQGPDPRAELSPKPHDGFPHDVSLAAQVPRSSGTRVVKPSDLAPGA